jgi:CheY-like chemotaxis protein
MVPDAMAAPTILLVDDNQELLTLLARLVESEGWIPVTVTRGRAAIDRLAPAPPAAAVVDVLLPDMMGYDVAHALRNARVPFVFMTGVFKGGRAATEASAQHGAAGYFEKPFDARKLMDALRALLPPPSDTPTPMPIPARAGATPPPVRRAAVAAVPEPDFDVEVAVESDEPVAAMELTGRVVVTEDGKGSAVLRGEAVTAAPVVPPPRRTPIPTPRPAATPVPDLSRTEGRLEDNLPHLVTAFHLAQQTGALTLQKGKVKKTLFFDAGRPCFAISNLLTDRFGSFLVRVGKLSSAQLEQVRAEAERSRRRSGEIMVELGLLQETERLYYLAQQVKSIAYSMFAWEEGAYRLHFTDRAAQEAVRIELPPASLISRGVKKLYRPERLSRLLQPEDRLIPSAQPAYGLHEVELDRWEAELLPRVDGTRTLAELVHVAHRPAHAVYAFLYGLVALQILDRA